MSLSTRTTALGSLLIISSSLMPGCYKKFQLSDEEAATGGASATGGAGGETGSGGNSSSGGVGTGGGPTGPITTQPDTISVEQGATVLLNVLDNDEGTGLELTGVDDSDAARPASLGPESLSFEADGQVSFKAADDFWGVYRISYSVKDENGDEATGTAEIQVVPRAIKLSTLELGWGGFVIDGATADSLGQSAAAAGDVNGDGIGDLLLGAPSANSGSGRVALVLGRDGIATSPHAQDLDLGGAEANVQIFSGITSTNAGASVTGAGDMNGDGLSDVVIGAAFLPGDGPSSDGFVHVLWGSNNAPAAPIQLSATPAATVGFTVEGEASARLGGIVSGGGDINFDGNQDIVLYSTVNTDSIHALFGPGENGDVVNGTLTALTDLEFSPTTLRFAVGVIGNVFDENAAERAEVLVATTDGFALLRGQTGGANPWPSSTTLSPDEGWLSSTQPSPTVVLPPDNTLLLPSVATAGEFDGNPGLDLVYCTGDDLCRIVPKTDDPTTYSLDAGRAVTGFGAQSGPRVSGGGDTNGDGFDDLLFATDASAYVVRGQEQLPTGALDISALGTSGYSIAPNGEPIGQVALLGDVNGDDLADYAITVPTAESGAGRVYVIYGTPGALEE